MQVARLRAFVENGKASVSELSQQEATLASSRLTATQADNKRLISLLTLTQLLELPTPEGFAIVSPNVEKVASIDGLMTPDDIYLEAIGFKPEIRSEELRLKGAEHSINIAKAGHYPKLNLNAGLSTNYNTISDFESESFGDQLRHKFAQFVGLNLSIPIFNRFQVRNNIRSAKADRHNQMLKLESVKKTLYKEIQQVYYNVLNAHSKVNSSKEAVQSSQTAFELMQVKYENGKANITEFNEAKNKYLNAESDFVQARYEQLYQRALLDFYRGRELDF
jgi:outer membrane protein